MSALQILVVDDDVDFANSLSDLLSLEGHQVDTTYSGEEAVEEVSPARLRPDFHGRQASGQETGWSDFLKYANCGRRRGYI